MSKKIQNICFFILICLTFICVEKIVLFLQESDELMIKIKSENESLYIKPVNAVIKDNTIIPGISGREIDVGKSYQKLKKIGSYNYNFLEYKRIEPAISLNKQYDKYIISGNYKYPKVSLMFRIKEKDNIEQILKILNLNKIKSIFFIDNIWLENNNDLVLELIKKGHNVGILNNDIKESDFIWLNTIMKKINKGPIYCHNWKRDDNFLKMCSVSKNYSIIPTLMVKNTPFLTVKSHLKNGSLISLPINKAVGQELEMIIKYIYSKGFSIESIKEILKE